MLKSSAGKFLLLLVFPASISAIMTAAEFKRQRTSVENTVQGEYNGVFHFYDTYGRNHNASQELCRAMDSEADLVVIQDKKHYNRIRLDGALPQGTYWVNGRAKWTNRQFDLEMACEFTQDLSGINFGATSTTRMCLALVKSSSPLNSYLQELPCTSNYRALCGLPLECTKVTEDPSAGSKYDSNWME